MLPEQIRAIHQTIAEDFRFDGESISAESGESEWRELYNKAVQKRTTLTREDLQDNLLSAYHIQVYLLAVVLFTFGNWEMYSDILDVMPALSRKPRYPGAICLRLLTPLPESFNLHSEDDYPAIRAWFDEHGDQIEWDSTENRYRWKSL